MLNHLPHVIRRHEPAYEISRDCDCACSDTVPLIKQLDTFSLDKELHISPNLGVMRLQNDYQIIFVASGDGIADSIAVLNDPAWNILSAFDQLSTWKSQLSTWHASWGKPVVENVLSSFLESRFIVSKGKTLVSKIEQSQILAAWLHLTDRCNLRCAYCYLPHARADMSLKIGYAAIEAIFRSAIANNYRAVKLKYAGGEPLLRFPVITELQKFAKVLADKNHIHLEGVILSNGTLLNSEILETMKILDLRLMISLDGLDIFHDSQRPFADGRGSTEFVIRAVKRAINHNIVPDISVTVTNRNIDGLSQVVNWILENDLPFSINFYRDNDYSASKADLQLQEQRIIDGMLAAYKAIETNLPRRSLLASLADRANLSIPHMRTCGVGQNYLVFDYQGGISKCQMQIGKPITNVYDHDPLLSIQLDLKGVMNLSVEEKEGCRDCEWKYWCTGGCPLHTYRATGRYDVKSPNCNIYKALYPEIVRLEGLRLLKYAKFT